MKLNLRSFVVMLMTGLLCLWMQPLAAQGKVASISGTVLDAGVPVEYANVVLYQNEEATEPLALSTTDAEGFYELIYDQEGSFYLKVSFIGYTAVGRTVTLKPGERITEAFELNADPRLLEAVEISAEKSNVTYLLDKKIVSFNKEMIAGTSSAAEVLQKVPEISVDARGNLKLRGNSGVSVLIDGKPSMLSPADIVSNLASANIVAVEIITSPSAKYDPDGSAGIINIITKRESNVKATGVATAGVGLAEKYNSSLQLDVNTGRWTHYLTASQRHEDKPASELRRFYDNGELQYVTDVQEDKVSDFIMAQLGTEVELDSNTVVYISYQYSDLDEETPVTFTITDFDGSVPQSGTGNVLFGIEENKLQSGFSRQGKRSSLSSDIVYSNGSAYVNSDSRSGDEMGVSTYSSAQLNEFDFHFFDYSADFSTRIGNAAKLEIGYAGEEVVFSNLYQSEFDGVSASQSYDYKESIQAAFSMLTLKKEKYTVQAGLRFENILQEISVDPKDPYQNLYPSMGFEYTIDEERSLSLNYSRRISRPDPFQFSPFERQANSREVVAGNPDLNPAYSNNVEMAYNLYKEQYGLRMTLFLNQEQDQIKRILTQQADLSVISFDNIDVSNTLGFSMAAETQVGTFLSLDASADVIYHHLEDAVYSELNTDYVYTIIKLNQAYSLGGGLSFQINANYTSSYYDGLRRLNNIYNLGATIEKSILKKRGDIALKVDRIVYSGERGTRLSGLYEVKEDYIPQNPIVRLSFSYRF